jgi:CxxC motif-containing protein (DUF1111 family)
MTVEIGSDFKRHDMGTEDSDSKPFNQTGASFFMTPPLWGIRNTAPYLHDGRAPTLLDSVRMHGGGDDVASVNAFKALAADDQAKIFVEQDPGAGRSSCGRSHVRSVRRILPPVRVWPITREW